MADQIELLKQLQVLDGELYKLRRQQQEKPAELEQVAVEVAAQEAALKTAEEQLSGLQLSQKAKDMELQTREANIKKLQGQLFQVKTNKEYSAMQREIESLKADQSLFEEAILGLFDAIDEATKVRQRERDALAARQERQRAERARIDRELAEIAEQVARLEQARGTLAPQVPAPARSVYEQILAVRAGLALVPLLNDSCGGCHQRLPPQVINEVYLKAKLVMCEHCSRILYFDEAHSRL